MTRRMINPSLLLRQTATIPGPTIRASKGRCNRTGLILSAMVNFVNQGPGQLDQGLTWTFEQASQLPPGFRPRPADPAYG
jgi:hypothetical protein